jgi:hypothetical protein
MRTAKGANWAILGKVLLSFKGLIPKRYRDKINASLLYYYVIESKINPVRLQKICFFYKPDVPDFGTEFMYVKLGKKENIFNPNSYSIIFEADLPDNISRYNQYFFDYSGLYALYKNNLIQEDYVLLIHYDTQIRHKQWIDIIKARVRKNNVVFSDWAIDDERAEICRWIYKRIDTIFLKTHKETFLSLLKMHNIFKIPNSSQFACRRETFHELMEYLSPIYEYILSEKDFSFKYAHLLERAWGLFFALERYQKVAVIADSHSQSKAYGENYDDQLIDMPILTTALERNVASFSEILENK